MKVKRMLHILDIHLIPINSLWNINPIANNEKVWNIKRNVDL